MTTKQMDQLNKRTRIAQALRAGTCTYTVAAAEKVTIGRVVQVARREGIRYERHQSLARLGVLPCGARLGCAFYAGERV